LFQQDAEGDEIAIIVFEALARPAVRRLQAPVDGFEAGGILLDRQIIQIAQARRVTQ
jgi:hypothetical protein